MPGMPFPPFPPDPFMMAAMGFPPIPGMMPGMPPMGPGMYPQPPFNQQQQQYNQQSFGQYNQQQQYNQQMPNQMYGGENSAYMRRPVNERGIRRMQRNQGGGRDQVDYREVI